jgi:hypothetical protein
MTTATNRFTSRPSMLFVFAGALAPAFGACADHSADGQPLGAVTETVSGPVAPSARLSDFDGDHRADIALTGGIIPGTTTPWGSIPVAFSNGNGSFRVTNLPVPDFGTYATQSGAMAAAGDFNGDGLTDIALAGGAGWNTVPVAFSNGDGTFRVTNLVAPGFPDFASQAGVQLTASDFNGDGRADLALTGGADWNTIPVAFSRGDGTFNVSNFMAPAFALFATQYGAHAVAGDFNGDGRGDLALTGGESPVDDSFGSTPWTTIPVAFSNGNGTFSVSNFTTPSFPLYATQATAVVAADFDGDGRADLALAGGNGWNTIPVAFSNGNGTFRVTNTTVTTFPTMATQVHPQLVAADFDGDGRADLALIGGRTPSTGAPWGTTPVAFSGGDGSFRTTHLSDGGFSQFATQSLVTTQVAIAPTALAASQSHVGPHPILASYTWGEGCGVGGTWESQWGSPTGLYRGTVTITETSDGGLSGTFSNGKGTVTGTFTATSQGADASGAPFFSGTWNHAVGSSGGRCQNGTLNFSLRATSPADRQVDCHLDGSWGYCADTPQYVWLNTQSWTY